MNLRSLLISAGGVAALTQFATPAGAATLIDENFNSLATGLAFTTPVGAFNVTSGDVDVIGAGYIDIYPGYGNYIDLDGDHPSTITSGIFNFQAGDTVNLSFDYGANLFDKSATVSLGSLFADTISGNYNGGFTTTFVDGSLTHYSGTFTVGSDFSGALNFASNSLNPNSNGGIILDNVNLERLAANVPGPSAAVPEPFTIIGTLVGGTAALRMRKKLKSSK
jgi:hypothetical protein